MNEGGNRERGFKGQRYSGGARSEREEVDRGKGRRKEKVEKERENAREG